MVSGSVGKNSGLGDEGSGSSGNVLHLEGQDDQMEVVNSPSQYQQQSSCELGQEVTASTPHES